MFASHLGLTGRIKAAVLRDGVVLRETDWMRNLWLDAGLNRMATLPICDLFKVAVKGQDNTPTSEDLTAGANTYSISNGGTTITRTAGARNFAAGDVGKLIKFDTTPFAEFTIITYTDATHVVVSPAASAAVTSDKIVIYSVQQVGLGFETGRTQEYSAVSGENGTTTAVNVRTFTRSFIFPSEDTITDTVETTNTYSQSGTTVTRVAGSRSLNEVGYTINFLSSGLTAVITAYIDASNVTVDVSQTNAAQNISLTYSAGLTETVTGTYSRSGATVTRASGARNFTSGDIGKIIHFVTSNVEAKITAYTDATHVTVDVSGTLAAQSIVLYGFTDYIEFGFSHSTERADNLNVRVVLDTAVRVHVSTGLNPSEQLKLTYECTLTVSPAASTPADLASITTDPGSLMSANKNGDYAIETFATSIVNANGLTGVLAPCLDPYYAGHVGLSLNTDALAAFTNKVRSSGAVFMAMTADAFTTGVFSRVVRGTFGLNDAINNNWRSLMIYEPTSQQAVFTFLYDVAQKKDGTHTLLVSFTKTWNRDLS